ncbi:S41 family peptidase [Candidatus Daviesbacteria bacterium]|nr:S41 family peptidase [Candidatus Daviesbacteria bacterium]
MNNIFKRLNLFTILLAILTFVLGWQLGHRDMQIAWSKFRPTISIVNKEPPQNINIDFKLFWDTWDLVSREYLDKKAVDPTKMFYGAIQGMVQGIGDPYTVFLPPDAQKSTQEGLNGSFEGVGIQLGFNKDKRLVVIAPLDGTPAERAGLKPQDLIIKIDGKDTTSITLPEAVKLIRGLKGSQITLTVFREGEEDTKDYKIVRDTIIVKSVVWEIKETKSAKKMAVLRLSRFGERTQDEWQKAVSDVLSKAPQGIVLDLRNNPGGFLEGAVFIASEFLEDGTIVFQENQRGERLPYQVNRQGKLLKLPMVVLINKGSASASEIVAGALQDRKRAKLVGEQSFGKGTIQEAEELPGGTGVHITTAKWLTPKGYWVNETDGLKPDVKIEMPKDLEKDQDPQLEKALELLVKY